MCLLEFWISRNGEVSFLTHEKGVGFGGGLGDQLNILLVIFQDMAKGRSGVSWEEGVRFVGPG